MGLNTSRRGFMGLILSGLAFLVSGCQTVDETSKEKPSPRLKKARQPEAKPLPPGGPQAWQKMGG